MMAMEILTPVKVDSVKAAPIDNPSMNDEKAYDEMENDYDNGQGQS